jgi:hypothetical protein
MMSSYVTVVYVNCGSWRVHGSHSVCLLKPVVTQAGSSIRPCYTTPKSTPAHGSSGQQTQQTQATPQASTPAGPIAPNTSINKSCFKCG